MDLGQDDATGSDSELRAGELRAAVAAAVAELAAWAATIGLDDIPEAVGAHAGLVLFDDLAAMLAARDEPEVVALHGQLLQTSGPPESTIFNGGTSRADRYSAAVANAAAADWCELDEGYRVTTCHAGLYVLPALLAEAEAAGVAVEELLRVLTVAYEVTTRFARAFPDTTKALHPHGCFAALGAAAATALVRGYDAQTLQDAITAASTLVAPGPFGHAVEGALVRNLWPATGAWSGMRAADWARIGIAGLAASPFDVYVGGFGSSVDATAFASARHEEWAIRQNFQKIHACCQYGHATVEATLALRADPQFTTGAEGIASIRVETHPRALQLDDPRPKTTLGAKFSIPHIAAATAVLGHAGADAFARTTLTEAGIARLREAVELVPFEPVPPAPNDRPARVTWQLVDGSRLQAECLSARGGPDRPFAIEEIVAKIGAIAAPVHPRLAEIAESVVALDPALLQRPWRDLVAAFTGSDRH